MKSKKQSRAKSARAKKAASPKPRVRVYSTSEARANFKEKLEEAKAETAIIGFGRYGDTVAALVPVEAVYILAGMGAKVSAEKRKQISKEAQLFVEAISEAAEAEAKSPPKAVERAAPRKKRGRARG